MANFNVRIFGYNGLSQMHVSQQRRYSSITVFMAEEPPVWSALATSNGATPVSIVFPGPGADTARVLGIEVPDLCQIRYELQLLGPLASNARTAGNLSRRMSGFDYIAWTAGATFSFVDASSYP
jgi:hypothetical protein